MQSLNDQEVLVNGSDAARLAGVTRHAVAAAARRGAIIYVSTPLGRLYTAEAVEDYSRRVKRRRRRKTTTTTEGRT